jgi:hypothetical protein
VRLVGVTLLLMFAFYLYSDSVNTEHSRLETVLHARDDLVSSTNKQLKDSQKRLHKSYAEQDTLQASLSASEAETKTLNAQLKDFKHQLAEKEASLAALQTKELAGRSAAESEATLCRAVGEQADACTKERTELSSSVAQLKYSATTMSTELETLRPLTLVTETLRKALVEPAVCDFSSVGIDSGEVSWQRVASRLQLGDSAPQSYELGFKDAGARDVDEALPEELVYSGADVVKGIEALYSDTRYAVTVRLPSSQLALCTGELVTGQPRNLVKNGQVEDYSWGNAATDWQV